MRHKVLTSESEAPSFADRWATTLEVARLVASGGVSGADGRPGHQVKFEDVESLFADRDTGVNACGLRGPEACAFGSLDREYGVLTTPARTGGRKQGKPPRRRGKARQNQEPVSIRQRGRPQGAPWQA